jgi:monofunctional biosynthetic peptidoglycan transglycosylase
VRAVIASEDSKFCSHYGFDLEAIDKALDRNATGGTLRGRAPSASRRQEPVPAAR